jgi:cytoplasmic iron level regulating protein YaaA (DUF328/UPF0246 family)
MTITHQKQEILQSLNSLDPAQAEKVMDYIRGLAKGNQNLHEMREQRLKHEAMKEIRQALVRGF